MMDVAICTILAISIIGYLVELGIILWIESHEK